MAVSEALRDGDRPAAQTNQDTGRETAPVRPAAAEPARSKAPGPDLSHAAYRRLRRDWQAHLDRIEDGRERLGTEVSRLERFSSAYRTQSRSRDRGRSWSM